MKRDALPNVDGMFSMAWLFHASAAEVKCILLFSPVLRGSTRKQGGCDRSKPDGNG